MFYDVRFDAIAPKSADSTEQEEVIRLIINVEAQTKFKPGYPLTKRAIYYCSRMISAQHGPIFTKSEYGKIRKVYSIWICTQPSDDFENTLTRYSIKPEQLIGEAQEETENYDLMSVVMICLGKPGTENHKGILKFMEVLLSSTRSGSEKRKILEEKFGVAMGEELEREVLEVCNLSQGVVELNDMTEMRSGKKSDMVLLSDYLTVSGTCFINQSSPVITISKNGIRFSKACHTRLDDCEYVELLYHPILQVVILRKSNHDFSTAMHWREDNDVHSAFSARAFSGLVFQTLNWRRNCRYQCRGICRGQGNAKFLIFELDESRILTGKNQYEQAEECSINLKCRLYRSKWLQSITVSDVMESGQVVENPMIGAIPSRNEVQRELDDLLMSM